MDELYQNLVRLSPKEQVPFRCIGCGECCKHWRKLTTMIGTSPEHVSDHLGGLFVHDPVRLVLRILHISAWRVCAE